MAHKKSKPQPDIAKRSATHGSPWIIRTYAGFGDAEATNERYKENLSKGQRGLSIAFDLPTQNGYDADQAMAQGEIGVSGVSVSHLGDMELLFDDIDLAEINTSMTINATAPWLLALYFALAKKRDISWAKLRGTTQNDLLKELVARGTYVFNPEVSLRLSTDLIAFAAKEAPLWNPINCCGYHYMESGASPAEEVGFAFGNALIILDRLKSTLSKEQFVEVVKRISFFINSGLELIPEISKVRAYGQLWTEFCEKEFQISDVKFRAGCQVRSLTLTEQQPEVNIVRIAYEALPVILSANYRVGALQLPGFREAQSLPDQREQLLSLRTQQVLMHETGITDFPDIFEGSKVIEAETQKIKKEAEKIAVDLRKRGYEKAITFISQKLTQGLVKLRSQWENGEKTIVGVNAFLEPIDLLPKTNIEPQENREAVKRHLSRLKSWKTRRPQSEVNKALAKLKKAAAAKDNIMPASIELAEAGGTTGEWTEAIESVLGPRYQAPLGYELQEPMNLELPKSPRPFRVLIAKCGLDGHVNAVKLLAYACSRAGLEVIFTGIKQSPDEIVRAALQEDVEAIGVSSLAGAHVHIAREIIAGLKRQKLDRIPFLMGGIIPPEDKEILRKMGVHAVFTPQDGKIGDIVQCIIDAAGQNSV